MFGVGRDLCGSPIPTPCRSRVTQSRLHSTASRGVWNISREGDSTTSLGSLGQGSVRAPNHSKSLATLKTSFAASIFYLTEAKLMETRTTGPQNRTYFQEVNDPSLHVLGTLRREEHKGRDCFDSQADKQILLFQLNIPGTRHASLKKQYHKPLPCHRSDVRKTSSGSDDPSPCHADPSPHTLHSLPSPALPVCRIVLPVFPLTGSPAGIKINPPLLVSVTRGLYLFLHKVSLLSV